MKINKLLFGLFLLSIIFSCTEQSKDIGWELKEKQDKVKAGIISELNQLFEIALTDAEEAERKLAELNLKITNTIPIMESDTELLSARNNVVKSIKMGRLMSRLNNDLENTDYTRIDVSAKLIKNKQEGIPSDIGTLLHYVKYFKNLLSDIDTSSDTDDLSKKLKTHIENYIKKFEDKIKSYPELSGNESHLENTVWTGIKYSFNPSSLQFPEQGAQTETQINFKEEGVFECESVMLPYIVNGFYDDAAKTFKDHQGIIDVVLRAEGSMGTTYFAGKQIKKSGEYYFGTDYLSLVFHFQDDYDMIVSINYNKDFYESSEMKRIVPLRDPQKFSYYPPLGESRVYVAVINSQEHFGVAQPYDSFLYINYLFTRKNLAPFSLMKSE